MARERRRQASAARLQRRAKLLSRQKLLAAAKRLRRGCAVVTQRDLDLYRDHVEGNQLLPTSMSFYLSILGDLLCADVLLVDAAGLPVLVHDQRQQEEIAAGMRRPERKVARRSRPAWVGRWERAAAKLTARRSLCEYTRLGSTSRKCSRRAIYRWALRGDRWYCNPLSVCGHHKAQLEREADEMDLPKGATVVFSRLNTDGGRQHGA